MASSSSSSNTGNLYPSLSSDIPPPPATTSASSTTTSSMFPSTASTSVYPTSSSSSTTTMTSGLDAADAPSASFMGSQDIIDIIMARHRVLEHGLNQLHASSNLAERKELLNKVTHDLAVHMAVEELVLYTPVKKELGVVDPKRFSADVLDFFEAHHTAKTVLDELYSIGPSNDRFMAKARILTDNVMVHLKDEEESFLPLLRKHWSVERLQELGDEYLRAEVSAPTRPHPNLPEEGILAAVCQYVAGGIDKFRDAVRDAIPHSHP